MVINDTRYWSLKSKQSGCVIPGQMKAGFKNGWFIGGLLNFGLLRLPVWETSVRSLSTGL